MNTQRSGRRPEDTQPGIGATSITAISGSMRQVLPPVHGAASGRTRDCALLFVLVGPQQGAVFTLKALSSSIGRDDDADVRLDADTISDHHARITVHADGASIEDLDSLNGTFVNEERVHRQRAVVDGDHLRFGPTTTAKLAITDELEENALNTLFALTLRDPLTRVYNRRYFDDRLHSEFSFARRHGTLLALVLLDIDAFKLVNDVFGHPIGDVVLRLVTGSIERVMRPEDTQARLGGDEIALIMRATSMRNAEILAERICRRVAALQVDVEGRELRVTVSAGVAVMGPGAAIAAAATLVEAADRALYRAKAAGGNRVIACTVDSDAQPANTPSGSTRPPRP